MFFGFWWFKCTILLPLEIFIGYNEGLLSQGPSLWTLLTFYFPMIILSFFQVFINIHEYANKIIYIEPPDERTCAIVSLMK